MTIPQLFCPPKNISAFPPPSFPPPPQKKKRKNSKFSRKYKNQYGFHREEISVPFDTSISPPPLSHSSTYRVPAGRFKSIFLPKSQFATKLALPRKTTLNSHRINTFCIFTVTMAIGLRNSQELLSIK